MIPIISLKVNVNIATMKLIYNTILSLEILMKKISIIDGKIKSRIHLRSTSIHLHLYNLIQGKNSHCI